MTIPMLKGAIIQLFTLTLIFLIFGYFINKNVTKMKKISISVLFGLLITLSEGFFHLMRYEELLLLLFMVAAFCIYYKFNLRQSLVRYLQALLSGMAGYLVVKTTAIITEVIIAYTYKISGVGMTPDHEFTWGTTLMCIVLLYVISGLFVYLINKVRIIFTARYKIDDRIYYLFAILLLIVALSVYGLDEAFRVSNVSMRFNWIVLVIMMVVLTVFIVAIWMFANATIKEQRFKSEQENIRNLELYMGTLENNYNEVRKFRHDIKNALSALMYRINEYGNTELKEDVQSLLKEYNFNVMSDQKIDGLHYINNPFIKGLIFSKYLEAQTKGVQFNIEVMSNVLKSSEKYSDEFRILGILLDNAIEAAANANTPEVTISIDDTGNYHSFLIVNTIDESISINLSDISKKGYSSKGTDRGLGLATVKEITDSSDSMLINFKIEKGKFIVSLSVDEEI